MEKLNIVFMGTPEFAVPILEGLIEKYNVMMVVSQPDKIKIKNDYIPTPTKRVALEHGIKVFQPVKIKDEYQEILDINPDIIITAAYGQIVPDIILNCPKYRAINVHGSLLPRLRGGAPIHHAIINGDKETGITIMYMNSKMDAGDILAQEKIEILPTDNLDSLYTKMSILGKNLLLDTIPKLISNSIKPIKQDETLITYGMNITKEEEKIDFNNTAESINNQIRGLSSIPGAYAILDNKRVKIYNASIIDENATANPGKIDRITKTSIIVNTKDKKIAITDIQIEGKRRLKVSNYLNGISNKEVLINKTFE